VSLSVIIPYNNAALYLELCLSSLLKGRENFDEVIVVSNGNVIHPSPPSQYESLVRILRYDEPLGYGEAINRGVAEARGKYLVFCDADTFFPQPNWIARHQALRQDYPNIGISSSKLINYRTDRILDFGIGRTRFNNFHPYRDALTSDPRVQQSRRVQMACSAAMMIEKALFQKLGGFDPALRYYYQDVDLSLRVKDEGLQIWVVADAIGYHRGHASSIVRAPFQTDERTYITLKHAGLFEVDYPKYLSESLRPYRAHLAKGPFGLVNLSTITDNDEVLAVISDSIELKHLAKWTPKVRDLEFIALTDVVDTKVLRYPHPLLILVDRFSSVEQNGLWHSARDTTADFVIDRNANAFRFDEITGFSSRLREAR